MKRKEIREFTSILNQAKSIMGQETDFEELRKSERKAILNLFEKSNIQHEFYVDEEGAHKSFGDYDELEVVFTSSIGGYKKLDNPYTIEYYAGEEEINTIDDALKVLINVKHDDIPLALLNTSILTTAGSYTLEDIDLDTARKLVADSDGFIDSAIGHQSTAEIMTTLLDTEVVVNRQMFVQQVGQKALVFKLNDRPEEGKILTAEEINEIGYKFQLLTRNS